jgi:hypothetical protein
MRLHHRRNSWFTFKVSMGNPNFESARYPPPGIMVKTFVMAARISLGWMMAQALALGMTMDPTVAAQFGTLPMEFALNAIRETWTPVDGVDA